MSNNLFPPLILNDWKDTRDTLHKYAQMVGAIREKLSKPHPHWWHISLRISDRGLTTTPIQRELNNPGQTIEFIFDLENSYLIIESNYREAKRIKLTGQSLCALCDETCSLLSDIGIKQPVDKEHYSDGKKMVYDEAAVKKYWKALKEIDRIFNMFRAELPGQKSPVQLWPHHFDVSMSWYSGRLVPGKDPNDPEASKEQMMFGFSTGDETIPDAYFYILTYPVPEKFPDFELPEDAKWLTGSFTGAVMMYEDVINSDNPEGKLLNYFRAFQTAGERIMRPVFA